MASNFAAQGRSGTFIVGTERQRNIMDTFQRNEQHFTEEYQKNKPLCFSARAYQMTHPGKMRGGHKDADATLSSPMLLGVADGVSQLEEFGMDAAELPHELLRTCEELAMAQLIPDRVVTPQDSYRGPVALLKEAYEATESLGSTTVLLGILDNSTRIHGKLHPMVAVLTIGDCELLMLRRLQGRTCPLQAVFHTEMQRIDGHVQTPLQLARVDERVDPEFDEEVAIEVIERGSAVHCVSAFEGDIVVLGSDGVFDNLFIDEILSVCDEMLNPPRAPGAKWRPCERNLLGAAAQRLVQLAHSKTEPVNGMYRETPIGVGGKIDDTSCLVGEVVEWTEAHGEAWAKLRTQRFWRNVFSCGGSIPTCEDLVVEKDVEYDGGTRVRNYPTKPDGSFSTYWGSFSEYGSQASFAQASQFANSQAYMNEGNNGYRPMVEQSSVPQGLPQRRPRRRRQEEDEEEEDNCSIM
mmetsp:Transcript_53149/g.97325  ORF Transcript_53149/g.97325 Transcript_53149/m.97325 type:complete len:465 (+) Transcript_53149:113-1507(+)